MISYSLYIIDDEESIRDGLTTALETDYQVSAFVTGEDAIDAIRGNPPDLVLLDIGLPGMNGVEVLSKIKEIHPDMPIIMITAYEDVNTVISAMKLGAYDYVIKPIHLDGLEMTIHNALQTIRLRKEVRILQEKYLRENHPCFIGESNAIQDVIEFIDTVAQSPDTPILIIGETGTGKELIARSIHYRSPNFKGSIVGVNCAAIPKDLIESELFGYEKGAFSGAKVSGKRGLIEEAANGTLFLDEVGDLSLEAQAKLLRFLDDGEFYRVGGTRKLQVRTRVVSATNKNLESMVEKETFRKDLYFRLGVVQVLLPSLNERRDDILPLAKHFLYEFSKKFNKQFKGISKELETTLLEHHWTGNVRELKNMIERGVLTGQGPELNLKDIGMERHNKSERLEQRVDKNGFLKIPPAGIDLTSIQDSLEKSYIKEALKMAGGNESKAARLLNINHHTFRYRRRKLQID
ncbi:MAG: sigma-54 dependent transcriptional regulator [Thermodesulfobacteriota bacterium]|nr:sigma-54 dependent transcriptional regulator [Thermodesulfobacteriota bacterium]